MVGNERRTIIVSCPDPTQLMEEKGSGVTSLNPWALVEVLKISVNIKSLERYNLNTCSHFR